MNGIIQLMCALIFEPLWPYWEKENIYTNISIPFTAAVFLADLKCGFFCFVLNWKQKDILKLSLYQLNAHEMYFPSPFSDYYSFPIVVLNSSA